MTELTEALLHWGVKSSTQTRPLPGGCCNQIVVVDLPESKGVLRIYNNGGDERKVLFEHGLLQLCESKDDLSTLIPRALPSLTGHRFVCLPSGAHACVFRFLPGRMPPLTAAAARAVGCAAARVVQSLAGIRTSSVLTAAHLPPDIPLANLPNPPFRFLWHAHRSFDGSQDAVLSAMARLEVTFTHDCDGGASSRAAAVRADLAFLKDTSLAMAARLSEDAGGAFASLPQQLVHADLHAGNILVEPVVGPAIPAAVPASAAPSADMRSGSAEPEIASCAAPDAAAAAASAASHVEPSDDAAAGAASHVEPSDDAVERVAEWRVTGILDWEFATIDWRALEAAIALSKFLPEPEEKRWALLHAWMDGFISAGGVLTTAEAQLFPELMLRHLVGFIYFLGNDPSGAAAGSRIASYAGRIRWIEASAEKLRALAARATAPSAAVLASNSSPSPTSRFLQSAHSVVKDKRYDLLLCDLWGTIHDGDRLCVGASTFFRAARDAGVPIMLLGNSPNTAAYAFDSLSAKGLPRELYVDAVTSGVEMHAMMSGEVASDFHAALRGKRAFHYGKPGAATTLTDLAAAGHLVLVDNLDDADFVVLTKPYSHADTVETAMPFLRRALERKLPMICGSADNRAIEGGREVVCAGAMAREYRRMGGSVYLHGKPEPSLYALAHARAEAALGRKIDKRRICMMGDSLETDVAGAQAYGIDSLFLLTGIHGADFPALAADARPDAAPSAADEARLARLCETQGVRPTFWARGL